MSSVLYTADDTLGISFGGTPDAALAGAAVTAADSASTPVSDTLVAPATQPPPRLRQPHLAVPLASGAVGGFLLGVGAAYVGAVIADQTDDSNELAALGGAITGWFIGEPLGVALGTHWGNRSKGSFGADLAIAFLTGIVGTAIAIPLQAPGVVIGGALQLGATTWIERRIAQDKYEKQAASTSP